MTQPDDTYHQKIQKLIDDLTPVFASAAVGDFSSEIVVPDEDGDIASLYAGVKIILDVVREKVIELEHRAQEKEELLASIGDGVVVLDVQGNVTFINPSGERLCGWMSDELMGKPWITTVHMQYADGTPVTQDQRPYRSTLSQLPDPLMSRTPVYCVRKNGSRFPVSTTVSHVMVGGQHTTIIVFRDVTSQLAVERLQTDFLSIAAHQLRSPLSNIRWTLEFLLHNMQDEIPVKLKAKLQEIYEDNLNMISLVNDILGVARISEGMIETTREATDVTTTINAVIREIQPEADQKQITVVHTPTTDAPHPTLTLDPTHLHQVIQNIISNSIKYSEAGKTVTIKEHLENNELCIQVTDQGIGIPHLEQKDIFNRFFRGSNVVHAGIPGSGLGLFVAKAYVESWGGHISITSKEHEGTTVSVCTPIQTKESV